MQKKTDFLRIPNPFCFLRLSWNLGWIGIFCFFIGCEGNTSHTSEASEQTKNEARGGKLVAEGDSLPKRIISTAPNITEIIFALGGEAKLVARSQACDFPMEVEQFPIVKTYPELDLEQIAFHKPDIILTTDELFSSEQIARMKSGEIPLYVQSYKSIPQILSGIKEIGEIVGEKVRAANLMDSLQQVVDEFKNVRKGLTIYPKSVLIVGEDPLIIVGGGGYIHELMELAGWSNVFRDKELAYFQSTIEELQWINPDVIFFPAGEESDILERFEQFPLAKKLKAVQTQKVFKIPPDLIYRPGPRAFQGLKEFAKYRRDFIDG